MTITDTTTGPLTITDAAAALRSGSLTAVGLAERSIAQADRLDDAVGIYISRFDEQLLEAAAAADADLAAGKDVGPLHGIPLGIKDIITTREGETTAQSLVLDRSWGRGDAVVVRRLREAGGLITGKLTTMEYACGVPDPEKPFPICRNPWDLDHWAGGSSSGTGSGIAAGVFLGGLGTDTGGSIRIPAMFCGVTGLMPTAGRVPKSGCVPLGYSLDHIGPLARSARDCALMLQALAGYDASDATALDVPVPDYPAALTGDLSGLTIGVDLTSGAAQAPYVDPRLEPLLRDAIDELVERGATVVELTLPLYEEGIACLWPINSGESGAYHRPDAQTRLADYSFGVRAGLAAGVVYSAADYVQAQRARRVVQKAMRDEVFDKVDLVLTPAAFQGAVSLAELAGPMSNWFRAVNTPFWDLTGHPVITVPIGFTEAGLPLAMQLAGRPFDEATVLRAADAYQRGTSWHLAVPQLAL
jgi:aspartyl-tRNA(Asn)/glutamyl-tRNA(Gln) amidotransferase subunit A